ncbi:MAG: hypothetical protein AABX19_04745 [Nanoarchaeota archaeon]
MGLFDFLRKHKKKTIVGVGTGLIAVYFSFLPKLAEKTEEYNQEIVTLQQQIPQPTPQKPKTIRDSGRRTTPQPTWKQAIEQIEELEKKKLELEKLKTRIERQIKTWQGFSLSEINLDIWQERSEEYKAFPKILREIRKHPDLELALLKYRNGIETEESLGLICERLPNSIASIESISAFQSLIPKETLMILNIETK